MTLRGFSWLHAALLRQWFKRVAAPIREQLEKGIPVSRVAWSATIGLISAIWPQIGTNVVMAWILARIFGCSSVVAGGVSFLASPLQYVLMLPHLRLGEKLLGLEPFETSVPEIMRIVLTDPIGSFRVLGLPLLHAVLGWITVSLVIALPLQRMLAAAIRRAEHRRMSHTRS